jgi:hypothetical protein
VVLGVGTAWITFGILDSTASVEAQKYKLGGAIAGALVTMSLLFSAYKQISKSSGDAEMEKLRERIEELQGKVMRGAPCPSGFETEVDERQRVVLAKPEEWKPRGGQIFDFAVPYPESQQKGDIYPARFSLEYIPPEKEWINADVFYEYVRKVAYYFNAEFVNVGGESGSIKSLKLLAYVFLKIEFVKDAVSGIEKPRFNQVTQQEFEAVRAASKPPAAATAAPPSKDAPPQLPKDSIAAPGAKTEYCKVKQMQVLCFHPGLKRIFIFNFYDDEKDFTESSALFNQTLNSVRFLT